MFEFLIWKKSNYLQQQDDLKDETEDDLEHRMKELEQEKQVVEFLQKHIKPKKKAVMNTDAFKF